MQIVENVGQSNKISSPFLPWIVCFCASLFFFYEFIQGNMFASIADNIMHDFHVQADKMTYLSSVYYLSNVLFLFVAGIILDKYSPRKTILLAMFMCVLSTFVLAHATSWYLALICRFVTGIGSAFCFLGPVRLASRWFPPKRMALVTGIIVTMAMTGGMLAQYPLTRLVSLVGWRDAVSQVGLLGSLMFIIMLFGVIDRPEEKTRRETNAGKTSYLKKAWLNISTLKAAMYTSLMNMAIAVFGAMIGSLYLVQRLGVSKEEASLVNTMLFLGSIIGGPVMGLISDRLGLRILPMKIATVASLIVVVMVVYAPVSLGGMQLLFFLLGLFTAAQIISYALVAESNPHEITATALSVISVLTQGGYILYQNLFSWMLVKHGGMHYVSGVPVYSLADYQFAAMILPLGFVLAWFILRGLKEQTRAYH